MVTHDIVTAIHARLARALARPTQRYRPLLVDAARVGWLDDARAQRLAQHRDVFVAAPDALRFVPRLATADARSDALADVARALADDGLLSAWRDERYAVATAFAAPPLFLLERAAARFFGIRTYATHLNGLVETGDATQMWIARRSPGKAIDPGMLDNLVGGGIAAGATVAQTLVKEAQEEAGIAAALARTAQAAGAVHVCREAADGLQCETIFVFDLDLAPDWTPTAMDGEVVEHRRVSLADAAALASKTDGSDMVTIDASLVIADCLLRRGRIAPDAPGYLELEALRHPALQPG